MTFCEKVGFLTSINFVENNFDFDSILEKSASFTLEAKTHMRLPRDSCYYALNQITMREYNGPSCVMCCLEHPKNNQGVLTSLLSFSKIAHFMLLASNNVRPKL